MEDILFWIFIATVTVGVGTIGYLLYKEMFDPYDGYETYGEYYVAKTKKERQHQE